MIKKQRRTVARINKTKSLFFEKIDRQTISQTHQEKKGEESNHQIRNENGEFKQTTQKYKGS